MLIELTDVLTYERPIGIEDYHGCGCSHCESINFDLISAILINYSENFQAKIVAEAANGPVTASAETILEENKIVILPDLLLNAVSFKDFLFRL
jgi:hypothetical protein